MRGLVLASERFSSHLVVPSCGRNRSTQFALCAGPTRLIIVPARDSTQWRSFNSNIPRDSSWNVNNSLPNDRRSSQTRVANSRLSTTSILEGGGSHYDHVPHTADAVSSTDGDLSALKATFYEIIQDGQPDQVMDALLDPRNEELVGSMPQTVFVEVFHLLSPAYFVVPYREIHRPIHPSAAKLKRFESLDSIFNDFATKLATVVSIRRSAGQALGLAEYTHLLDCARSIGDALMADYIWHSMTEDEVVPDVTCYNHYMEAKVWDKAYTGRERYHTRMTPYAYRHRRFFHPNVGWQGYRTAEKSVRKEVLQIFNSMTEQGYHGDEVTFINVMLASSRVGHVQGMKNVLKVAWNVDIDALATLDPSELPPATSYDRSSPLYPSGRLLFAIAHAFGTNNDISGALRAIEFISNSYDISVPETVWLELLERSFVLSRNRFGPDAKRNSLGKVPPEFVKGVFETMTSSNFDVRPTIDVHRILAKTAWDQARLSEFQQHMCAAYDLLRETRQKRRTAKDIIEAYLGGASSSRRGSRIDTALLQSRGFAEAVHTYDVLRLRTAQQTIAMERFARLLVTHKRWTGRDNPVWERCLLPQMLEEWQDFLPQSFQYRTRDGQVNILGATHWGQHRLALHNRVPVRRPTAENGVELDEEAMEMDDDFVWAQYLRSNPGLDLNVAPLKRLFSGVVERTRRPRPSVIDREYVPEPQKLDYEADELSNLPEEDYAETQWTAQRQKGREVPGVIPGNFDMVFS
ncbi:mitochondrial ATPase expression-domain-containing protein [Aspergillus caelatus]|uniref:Mitochondrial ATPase expression-domain-containing protein n=2 Tax=Aspergillus subgen. Circumdati TaxID=2720871 RepID=A0A5N7A1E2_9EURO|nr:mitochondrial ATPase expression-domain-containing protein [Aspergillus caelatus]KAE8363674.1 mitochondrial ATPase expression-domain-containing protein [Aspergillus caelatus]KAE8410796.1 mitochondrial ATPase expression-domain-containing protein [Aspergillus pseudocaelatus]